jgi:hypothetical protein
MAKRKLPEPKARWVQAALLHARGCTAVFETGKAVPSRVGIAIPFATRVLMISICF